MADNESHSSGNSEQPIIIKKIKKGGHGHHGGAWKVAYADFVTALMAFFIVMWILASSEEVKEAVADYFNAPENYSALTGKRTAPIELFDHPAPPAKGDGDGQGKSTPQINWSFKEGKATDTVKVNEKLYEAVKDSVKAAEQVESTGDEIKKKIDEMIRNATTEEEKNILSSIKIEITQDGMRIELLESFDNNFFEIGSAKLKSEAIKVLKQLAIRIGRLGNYVEIEGHTDSRGYANKLSYSNWELSSDRANSARKILETSGLWSGQITSVSGFADRKLRNPNNPFDYSNRRISILVKNLKTKDFISRNGENNDR
jgi:chemotaxis protein MotB